MAEWSKAVDLGSIPKGRGFKPHLLHFLHLCRNHLKSSILHQVPGQLEGSVSGLLVEIYGVLVAEGVVRTLMYTLLGEYYSTLIG